MYVQCYVVLYLFIAHSSAATPDTATDDIMNLLKTQITNTAVSRDKTSKVTATIAYTIIIPLVAVCVYVCVSTCVCSARMDAHICMQCVYVFNLNICGICQCL